MRELIYEVPVPHSIGDLFYIHDMRGMFYTRPTDTTSFYIIIIGAYAGVRTDFNIYYRIIHTDMIGMIPYSILRRISNRNIENGGQFICNILTDQVPFSILVQTGETISIFNDMMYHGIKDYLDVY